MQVTEVRVTFHSDKKPQEIEKELQEQYPGCKVELLTWCADEKLFKEMERARENERKRMGLTLRQVASIVERDG